MTATQGKPNAQTSNDVFVHTCDITKRFGQVNALAGISLAIARGESVAIMGPSGSGKSTLLHCLSGVLLPDSGTVTLNGVRINELPDAKRSHLRLQTCGFVFQDGQLIPELPGVENVALPLMLTGVSRGQAMARARAVLAQLGIAEAARRMPGEMSGGQGQRVAIARAMAGNPQVIFADEPTGALDQATGHEVMQILTTSTRMRGTTLVMVTHDVNVARWCDRIVEIRDGLIHSDQRLDRGELR